MLHGEVVTELLEDELTMARSVLGARAGDLRRVDLTLRMTIVRPDGSWQLRLDGSRYDAEPFDVALVDDQDAVLPAEEWIPGMAHSVHPVLGTAWVCVAGTRGYYLFPGHHTDRWDAQRHHTHAAGLLEHLLTKAGV